MKLFKTDEEKKSKVLRSKGYGRNQRRYAKQKNERFWIRQYRQKHNVPAHVSNAEVILMMRKTRGLRMVTHKSALKAMRHAKRKAICITKGTWGKKSDPRVNKVAA